MSKPLIKPEQPPGAIVDDTLTPASQNPWYVLATLFGEQDRDRFDEELHLKNLKAWNQICAKRWPGFSQKIAEFLRQSFDVVFHAVDQGLYAHLDQELKTRSGLNAAQLNDFSEISFKRTFFKNRLCMRGFYTPLPLKFTEVSFGRGLDLSRSWFQRDVSLTKCNVAGLGIMGSSNFEGQLELEDFIVRNTLYCNDIEVQAGVRIDGLRAKSVFMDSAKIGGDCEIERLNVNMFSMRSAECAMNTNLSGNVQNRMSLKDLKTDFGCQLDGLYVAGDTDISGSELGGYFSATGSRFQKLFRSENVTYNGHAKFGPWSIFGNANFNGSEFRNRTSFANAYFNGSAPRFFQTELHGDTKFSLDPKFYPLPDKVNASEDADAYSRLRHVAKSNERPDAEHFFFRQEMRCKAVTEGFPDGWFIRAYGEVSDFGFSVWRPALGLLMAWLVPGFLYLISYAGRIIDGTTTLSPLGPFGLSFANLFSFLGLNRLYFAPLIKEFGFWLSLLAGAQTVAGVVLLFFLGLGLRNRFRLK